MASTVCDECRRRPVSTSASTFPYCSSACEEAAAARRARLDAAEDTDNPRPVRRPGTLRGL